MGDAPGAAGPFQFSVQLPTGDGAVGEPDRAPRSATPPRRRAILPPCPARFTSSPRRWATWTTSPRRAARDPAPGRLRGLRGHAADGPVAGPVTASRTPTLSCHRFNEQARLDPVLDRLRAGEDVALVSDGGTPGIADPGALLVRAAAECGPARLPGARPVRRGHAAVGLSGLPADRYVFDGFLPQRAGERRRRPAGTARRDPDPGPVRGSAPHSRHARRPGPDLRRSPDRPRPRVDQAARNDPARLRRRDRGPAGHADQGRDHAGRRGGPGR